MESARPARHSKPKGGATDRPIRKRCSKARTIGSGKVGLTISDCGRTPSATGVGSRPRGGEAPIPGVRGAEPVVAVAEPMTIDDAKEFLREHWPDIRSQLLAGTYQPQPVKRVEI